MRSLILVPANFPFTVRRSALKSLSTGRVMHIFVDETGSFGGIGKFPSPSLVGALVIPDEKLGDVEKEFAKLRTKLPLDDKGEVKGKSLDEDQVASVVPILFRNSALFFASAIDLGAHTEEGLKAFQTRQAETITANLTPEHSATLVEQAHTYRKEFESFKLPLMVQSVITFELLPSVIELSSMYYSMRRPEELGNFHWVIDGKGNLTTPNDWERWWSIVIMPYMQTRYFSKPFKQIPIGNYAHMKRFETEPDDFIKKHGNWKEGDPNPLSINPIMQESLKFTPSAVAGLELVDIITNATRRALVGNLQPKGWCRIPELMIHQRKGYINFHGLEDIDENLRYPYWRVVNDFRRKGRVMIPTNLRNKVF